MGISKGLEYILKLKSKIEDESTLLSNMNYKIISGVKTGFNEAYLINSHLRNELIQHDSNNIEIIKPVLRGRDLKRYEYSFDNIYLINAHNGLKSQNITAINVVNDYPLIYQHFNNYRQQMEIRPSKGNHWTNMPSSFSEEYSKPKIIWGELSDKAKFTYDDSGYYVEATVFLMTGDNLKYILSIFNSKLAQWYFEQIATSSGMGTNRWKKYKIEQFPIKVISDEKINQFEILVNQILEGKKTDQDTAALEHQIDVMVYHLYALSYEEACVIDNGLSKEDFEFYKIN